MAARPRCGEAKKVAKGTGIMALTANARLPRNKKSGLQFLIAAKDRGFPQRGGVSGHLRPRIGLTGGSKNDEFGSICWADKTHPLSSCLPGTGILACAIDSHRQECLCHQDQTGYFRAGASRASLLSGCFCAYCAMPAKKKSSCSTPCSANCGADGPSNFKTILAALLSVCR